MDESRQRAVKNDGEGAVPSAQLVPSPNVICAEVGGDVVLLDMVSGEYFGLNRVGACAWAMLRQGCTADEVRDRLLPQFEVDPQVLSDDLLRLWAEMKAARLLTTAEG